MRSQVNYIFGSATSQATDTETILTIASSLQKIKIVEVKIKHTAGSAATFSAYITRVDGAGAPGTTNSVWVGTPAQAVGSMLVSLPACYATTSAFGELYLIFDPNTGSDNSFDYEVWWEALA